MVLLPFSECLTENLGFHLGFDVLALEPSIAEDFQQEIVILGINVLCTRASGLLHS